VQKLKKYIIRRKDKVLRENGLKINRQEKKQRRKSIKG
jgi:hypothetical protein